MRRVRASGQLVISNCVSRSMIVMVMSVIAMIMRRDVRDVLKRCRVGQRWRQQWHGSAER